MARGWIKMRKTLRSSPKVRRMARRLGIAPAHALGLLTAFWTWADDAATEEGLLPGLEPADVDDELGVDGFASAMLEAEWLALADGGLSIPEFDAYLGEKHQKRVKEKLRKRRQRARKRAEVSPWDNADVPLGQSLPVPGDCPTNVPPSQSVNTSQNPTGSSRGRSPRPDWRTDLQATEFAALAQHPGFADAWNEWLAYRRESRLKLPVQRTWKSAWRKWKADPAGLVEAIRHSIAQGFQGIYPPKTSTGSSGLPSERSGLMSASEAVALSRARRAQQGAPEGPRDVDPERPFRLVSGE